MRLTCDLDIKNRLLPSFNLSSQGKLCKAQLSVGRKPGSSKEADVYLMVCTKQDRSGTFYRLKGNIEQCFTKFVENGKTTLRFKEPTHDLCVSNADPLELKSFLSVVRLACKGQGLEKIFLSSLAPATAKVVEKLKTRLSITNKKAYPLTTNFPSSLQSLSIHDCSLRKVDSRILKLRRLSILDLSHNHLKCLPEFENLQLTELILSDNHLEELPKTFCQSSSLQEHLAVLDLGHNKLKAIRPYVCQLRALRDLKLDNNQLACLPQAIGQLSNLRSFSAADNQLRTLPATFRRLCLDSVNLGENMFLETGVGSAINKLQDVLPLLEITARAIRKSKLAYSEADVGPLWEWLSKEHHCLCGGYSFSSYVHYLSRLDLHSVAASVMAVDQRGSTIVPCEAFLCSNKCFIKYKSNPAATIWK